MAARLSRTNRSEAPAGDPPSTRDAILAAAIDILHRHGAGSLTVRSVAAAAGCSTTGVYTWFGGKNGLVEAIFVDGFRRFHDAQQEVLDADEPDLAALSHVYRSWALANPTHYQVMFERAVPDFEPSAEAHEVAFSTFAQLLVAAEQACASGEMRGPVDELAMHVWATVHGYVSLEISGMSPDHDPAAGEHRYRVGMERLMNGCRVRPTATKVAAQAHK